MNADCGAVKKRKLSICEGTVLCKPKNGSLAPPLRKLYGLDKSRRSTCITASKENHTSYRDFSLLAAGGVFFHSPFFVMRARDRNAAAPPGKIILTIHAAMLERRREIGYTNKAVSMGSSQNLRECT